MKVACTFLHSTSPNPTYFTGIENTESYSRASVSLKLDRNTTTIELIGRKLG
jgi:hypothetical protein